MWRKDQAMVSPGGRQPTALCGPARRLLTRSHSLLHQEEPPQAIALPMFIVTLSPSGGLNR